jgi:hypothetical protein
MACFVILLLDGGPCDFVGTISGTVFSVYRDFLFMFQEATHERTTCRQHFTLKINEDRIMMTLPIFIDVGAGWGS